MNSGATPERCGRGIFLNSRYPGVTSTNMSIDLKKLTNAQLNDLMNKAAKRKEELAVETLQKVRDRINKILNDEGLTLDQVFGGRRGRAKAVKFKVKPKYRNPADPSQVWTGRGLKPRWFAAALAAGKKEKDLLIA
jgi:DNA-binding protein H-NS